MTCHTVLAGLVLLFVFDWERIVVKMSRERNLPGDSSESQGSAEGCMPGLLETRRGWLFNSHNDWWSPISSLEIDLLVMKLWLQITENLHQVSLTNVGDVMVYITKWSRDISGKAWFSDKMMISGTWLISLPLFCSPQCLLVPILILKIVHIHWNNQSISSFASVPIASVFLSIGKKGMNFFHQQDSL